MRTYITFFFLLLTIVGYSQVTADLTIQNQQVNGTDFSFEIYITRTGSNDVYLGTADLVLTFNNTYFTNPTGTRGTSAFWNLLSTNGVSVGSNYRTATSIASITGNEIIINLNQINFGDQEEFDDLIAKIDNQPNTHRIGRYIISGINNPAQFMNLQWKTSGGGVITSVFTFENTSPWISSPVTINAINPPNAPLPVELTSFTSKLVNDKVQLNWSTKTEVNNFGFDIERSTDGINFSKIGFVEGNGNSNSEKNYSYIDAPRSASKYTYRLKQLDTDGKYEYSKNVEVEFTVKPTEYSLYQNYPNPFNPATVIKYQLPKDNFVSLKVFNAIGQEVANLVNEVKPTGVYEVNFNASDLSSGIYYYILRVGTGSSNEYVKTNKMILLK